MNRECREFGLRTRLAQETLSPCLPHFDLRGKSHGIPFYLHRHSLLVISATAFAVIPLLTLGGSPGACVTHRGRASVPQRMLSSTSMYALTVWISGLATLIEKKSRRLELAMYVMSRVSR